MGKWQILAAHIRLCVYLSDCASSFSFKEGGRPTLQTANFGRVYAAYSGVFIVLSVLWGWQVNKIQPDKVDKLGSSV